MEKTQQDAPTRPDWIKPRLEAHGSLEQLTQSVSTGGPGDFLFSDGPSE
ncbi:MAG: hypothetical protein IT479_11615 [Xanthomonadales bacterium]|nr:hypothetical protein [Xanthomonadales bacterium]MCC6593909.1 hypothetical protein [Xanthomonadales bacterium]